MPKSIIKIIEECQKGDNQSKLDLLKKFDPLIKKYTYKLGDFDAHSEFTMYFLELIQNIPIHNFENDHSQYSVLSYIKKSMYHQYIKLSRKKQSKQISFDEMEQIYLDPDHSLVDADTKILLKESLAFLTKLQYEVIQLRFFYGLSDQEIGLQMNISRQAVNRIKNRALKVLRDKLE